jgi:hypothetical protein
MTDSSWDKEKVAAASIEWAKGVMKRLDKSGVPWETAYLRFHSDAGHYGSSGSYVSNGQVKLLGSLDDSGPVAFTQQAGPSLRMALNVGERSVFVGLLTVHKASRDYKVDFDFEDIARWRITKLDGASGLPSGLSAGPTS